MPRAPLGFQVPLSDVYDEEGRQRYAPPATPEPSSSALMQAYRQVQPYPIDPAATVAGLAGTAGATGGPAGAVTQGLGQAARGVGDILSPAGKYIAGGLGLGAGATAAMSPTEAQAPNADPRIGKLQEYEAEIKRNQKVLTDMATQTFKSTTARKAAQGPYEDAARTALEQKTALEKELLSEETKRQKTTFKDSGMAQHWPAVQWAGPVAAAWLAKFGVRLDARAAFKDWNKAVNVAEKAMDKGNLDKARYFAGEAGRHLDEMPTGGLAKGWEMAKHGAKEALPYAAGAGTGFEAAMFPSQYDYMLAPEGSKAQTEASQALSFPQILQTAGRGAIPGALGGALGAHLPNIGPGRAPVAESRNLRDWLAQNPAPSAGPPAGPAGPPPGPMPGPPPAPAGARPPPLPMGPIPGPPPIPGMPPPGTPGGTAGPLPGAAPLSPAGLGNLGTPPAAPATPAAPFGGPPAPTPQPPAPLKAPPGATQWPKGTIDPATGENIGGKFIPMDLRRPHA